MSDKWIVMVGNLEDGFEAHGPFDNYEAASKFAFEDAQGQPSPGPCVMPLRPPPEDEKPKQLTVGDIAYGQVFHQLNKEHTHYMRTTGGSAEYAACVNLNNGATITMFKETPAVLVPGRLGVAKE